MEVNKKKYCPRGMLRFFTCGESLIPNKGTPEDDVTPRVAWIFPWKLKRR